MFPRSRYDLRSDLIQYTDANPQCLELGHETLYDASVTVVMNVLGPGVASLFSTCHGDRAKKHILLDKEDIQIRAWYVPAPPHPIRSGHAVVQGRQLFSRTKSARMGDRE